MASVDVRVVKGAGRRWTFVDLPFRLFKNEPEWVPPLRMTVRDRISPRHPAMSHQEVGLWVAYRDGAPVGRIGTCVDRLFNEFHNEAWAWVGYFECVDDPEAAQALFSTTWSWAAQRGMTDCVGPASFTTNDEIGLLVEGHKYAPTILTTHNPAYYEALWTGAGWEPVRDLWGWRFTGGATSAPFSERQQTIFDWVSERTRLHVRQVRMNDFDADVARFFDIYMAAWTKNWGFAPMTREEASHLARDLKRIIDPRYALLLETDSGEAVACALALPDVNQTIRSLRGGRLLPVGWWHLLRGVRHVTRARIMLLGIRPERQNLALGPLLYHEFALRLADFQTVEASWVLADNHRMNSAIETAGAERYKVWRLYQHSTGL